MAPSYANLFMGKFEQKALAASPHSPLNWWRYIDDVFLLWTHGEDKLDVFIKYLNSLHPNRIPFIVTFNPALSNIPKIIQRNLNILHSSNRCKEAFPSPPLISYRRSKNLRVILVRAKHRRPPPQEPGIFPCNRNRCKTFPFIKKEPHLTPFSLQVNNVKYSVT